MASKSYVVYNLTTKMFLCIAASIPAATSFYQTAVTSSQQNSAMGTGFYGYPPATQYSAMPFYPVQQQPMQTQPVSSFTPPTYTPTPPTYTPSPVAQPNTPKLQPSLVSYPTTPAQKPSPTASNSYQNNMSTPGSQNYNSTSRSSYVNPFHATGLAYQQTQQKQMTTPKFQGGGVKTPYKPPWLSGANSAQSDGKPYKPTWWNKKPSSGNNQVFYCEVCKISTAGLQVSVIHWNDMYLYSILSFVLIKN